MTELVKRATLGRHSKVVANDFRPGDTVEVAVKVKEGEKERIQLYKGIVIKTQGTGMGKSFTVRKISDGVGVERTFPYASPAVERVKVITRGKVRRGKLYFLRELKGKKARIQSEWGQELGTEAQTPVAAAAEVTPKESEKSEAEVPAPKASKKK